MAICIVSEKALRKIRRVPVKNDLVDVTCYVNGTNPSDMPVYATYRLVQTLKRHGDTVALAKLRKLVNRGVDVLAYNNNKKSNFIIDLIPQEYFIIERHSGDGTRSVVIDAEPLYATEQLKCVNG